MLTELQKNLLLQNHAHLSPKISPLLHLFKKRSLVGLSHRAARMGKQDRCQVANCP